MTSSFLLQDKCITYFDLHKWRFLAENVYAKNFSGDVIPPL